MRGHLPADATLDDYEHLIQKVLEDARAEVYAYWHKDITYVAVVSVFQERCWLVMFSLDGLMESAYIVEHPEQYLGQSAFERLGSLSEVLL
jgi:esterase/lipase superfamily enzyme